MVRKRGRKRCSRDEIVAAPLSPASGAGAWPRALGWSLLLLTVVSVILFRQVFVHPDELLWGNDIVRFESACKAVQYRSFWEYGQFPLWDPTILCGRSVVGDPSHAVLNPLAWLFWVSSSPLMFGMYLWAYTMLGAWGVCLFMRLKGAAPAGAVIAAIAFAFSGKTAGHVFAGHMGLLPTMMGLPWVFWAAERILRHRTVGSAVALGAVLIISGTGGHLPSLYWHMLFACGYVLGQGILLGIQAGWSTVRRPALLFMLTAAVVALGGMAWWLPVVRQTLTLSARVGDTGGGFAFSTWLSARPADLARLLWPFNGLALPKPFASDPENGFFWETASYPGLVSLALAGFLVLVAARDRRTVVLGALALVSILLALGSNTPLYRLAYELVPGLSLQRVPGRLFWYSNFFVACMAGFGMGELLKAESRRRRAFLIIVAAMLLAAMGGRPALDTSASNPASGYGLAVLVLGGLLLTAGLFSMDRLTSRRLAAAVILLSLLDLGTIWSAHVYTADPAVVFRSNSVVDFLHARRVTEGPFRFFDPTETVPQHLAARVGLESISGYHPGISQHQLEAYHALWGPRDASSVTQLLMHSPQDVACTPLLDAMNVRYVVAFESELDDRYRRVFTAPPGEFSYPCNVFERTDPLPRALLVPDGLHVEQLADATQRICALDPRQACVLKGYSIDGHAAYQEIPDDDGGPGKIRSKFETASPGVLVMSESWHPDWVAMEAGRTLPVYRADLGFLGIPIDSGSHSISVNYWPWDFFLGRGVSATFWLLSGLAWQWAKRRHPERHQ
jgi:hypothetical protein